MPQMTILTRLLLDDQTVNKPLASAENFTGEDGERMRGVE
jgi:hypothetical protein